MTIEANEQGRRAIDALPNSIRIGAFDFAIALWTHHQASGSARYGEFSSIEQVIRLQRDMPSRFKAVDTFFHEVSHAIFWVYGIHDEDKEERVVAALGSAWTAIYRDNPWLTKWITEAVRP